MKNNFNFLTKIIFFFKRPCVVLIIGPQAKEIKEKVFPILEKRFKINKDIFIFESSEEKINKFFYFLKLSKLPVLAFNSLESEPCFTESFFNKVNFVFNSDNENLKDFYKERSLKTVRLGFKEKNDIFISDIKENGGLNFKVNYKGSTVPFWFKKRLNQEELSIILIVIGIAITSGFNLVEISQFFRNIEG